MVNDQYDIFVGDMNTIPSQLEGYIDLIALYPSMAAAAAAKLRHARGGMAGYRDMNLYGTLKRDRSRDRNL